MKLQQVCHIILMRFSCRSAFALYLSIVIQMEWNKNWNLNLFRIRLSMVFKRESEAERKEFPW